ncbi:MAG: hypothetical protein ACSHX7_10275, partial [Luteolibacter sp.]
RFAATLIGAAIGSACLWVIPGGYGTALALAVSMLVMNAIAGLFPQWQYGVVAAVALALGSDNDLMQTSIDRTLAIGLGVFIGSVASLVIWPQTSQNRAEEFLRDALKTTRDILSFSLSQTNKEFSAESNNKVNKLENRFSSLISQARDSASNVRISDASAINDRIKLVTFLHNSLIIINKVAEDEYEIERGDGSFDKVVEETQGEIEKILEQLIDRSDEVTQEKIDEITSLVEKARNLAAGDTDRENWHHAHRVSLAYALSEIVNHISDFRKTYVAKTDKQNQ